MADGPVNVRGVRERTSPDPRTVRGIVYDMPFIGRRGVKFAPIEGQALK